MDTRRLRYFVQIVDSGSITRAASAIGVAQPALSQQVAVLENELKAKLLDRSVSGVVPTASGRILYAAAQSILRQYDELKQAVHREVQPLSGTVVVGMSPTIVPRLGLPLIEKVCNQHPEMRLQILEEGSAVLQEFLANGRIELCLSPTRPDGETVLGETVMVDKLVVVHPASWEISEHATLAELADMPWIVTRAPHSIRLLVDAVFTAKGLKPRIVVEIDSFPNVVEAVKRGIGLTVLPATVLTDELSSGQLGVRPFSDSPVLRPMYLAHRRIPALSRPAQFVHQLLRELAAELRLYDEAAANNAQP